jgi:putative membrane protein insertion efficiency factor
MTPAAHLAVGLVRTYQWTVRPLIGPHCRFWPSCSDYAVEAVCSHGAVVGSSLAARRILRCNPWHEGGYDPVPPPQKHRRTAGRASRTQPPGRAAPGGKAE